MKTLSKGTLVDLLKSYRTETRQTDALEHFDTLGLPGNKTEQYRHFSIKPILAKSYTIANIPNVTPQIGEYIEIVDGVVVRVVAVKGSVDIACGI